MCLSNEGKSYGFYLQPLKMNFQTEPSYILFLEFVSKIIQLMSSQNIPSIKIIKGNQSIYMAII